MEIAFKSKVSFNEYYKFCLLTALKARSFISIFVLISLPIGISFFTNHTFTTADLIYGFIPVLFLLTPALIYLSAKKSYQSTRYLKEEQSYVVNEDSIHIKSESSNHTIRWSGIFTITEQAQFVVIYLSDKTVLLFKKADIGDASKIEQLLVWGNEHLSAEADENTAVPTLLIYATIIAGAACIALGYVRGNRVESSTQQSVITIAAVIVVVFFVALIVAAIVNFFSRFGARPIPFKKVFVWILLFLFVVFGLTFLSEVL